MDIFVKEKDSAKYDPAFIIQIKING